MSEIVVPDFKPLNPENCYEISTGRDGFVVDEQPCSILMLAPATPTVSALVEACLGKNVHIPDNLRFLNEANQKLSENAFEFGSSELHEAAGRLTKIMNTEMKSYILNKFNMLADFFDEHDRCLVQVLAEPESQSQIAAYVGSVLLKDEVPEEYSEEAKYLEVQVSYIDRYGQVGVEPEGYFPNKHLLVRDDKLYTLGLELR